MKTKILSLLGLLVIGATAAYGSTQPKMNGKLIVDTLAPEEVRYTGKPYIKELGAYAFNYRNYDPQISRWTTPDPSGFPDGANNQAYAPNPTSEIDYAGLLAVTVNGTTVTVTERGVKVYVKVPGSSTENGAGNSGPLTVSWQVSGDLEVKGEPLGVGGGGKVALSTTLTYTIPIGKKAWVEAWGMISLTGQLDAGLAVKEGAIE